MEAILLQGLISAITIIIAYLLGKRQANINWERELKQRELENFQQNKYWKKRDEREQREHDLRMIDRKHKQEGRK